MAEIYLSPEQVESVIRELEGIHVKMESDRKEQVDVIDKAKRQWTGNAAQSFFKGLDQLAVQLSEVNTTLNQATVATNQGLQNHLNNESAITELTHELESRFM